MAQSFPICFRMIEFMAQVISQVELHKNLAVFA